MEHGASSYEVGGRWFRRRWSTHRSREANAAMQVAMVEEVLMLLHGSANLSAAWRTLAEPEAARRKPTVQLAPDGIVGSIHGHTGGIWSAEDLSLKWINLSGLGSKVDARVWQRDAKTHWSGAMNRRRTAGRWSWMCVSRSPLTSNVGFPMTLYRQRCLPG